MQATGVSGPWLGAPLFRPRCGSLLPCIAGGPHCNSSQRVAHRLAMHLQVAFDVAAPDFRLGQLLALELHRFEEEVTAGLRGGCAGRTAAAPRCYTEALLRGQRAVERCPPPRARTAAPPWPPRPRSLRSWTAPRRRRRWRAASQSWMTPGGASRLALRPTRRAPTCSWSRWRRRTLRRARGPRAHEGCSWRGGCGGGRRGLGRPAPGARCHTPAPRHCACSQIAPHLARPPDAGGQPGAGPGHDGQPLHGHLPRPHHCVEQEAHGGGGRGAAAGGDPAHLGLPGVAVHRQRGGAGGAGTGGRCWLRARLRHTPARAPAPTRLAAAAAARTPGSRPRFACCRRAQVKRELPDATQRFARIDTDIKGVLRVRAP